jgi:hypothetical protein
VDVGWYLASDPVKHCDAGSDPEAQDIDGMVALALVKDRRHGIPCLGRKVKSVHVASEAIQQPTRRKTKKALPAGAGRAFLSWVDF